MDNNELIMETALKYVLANEREDMIQEINIIDNKIERKRKTFSNIAFLFWLFVPTILFTYLGIKFENSILAMIAVIGYAFILISVVSFFNYYSKSVIGSGIDFNKPLIDYSSSIFAKLINLKGQWNKYSSINKSINKLMEIREKDVELMNLDNEQLGNWTHTADTIPASYTSSYALTWLYIYLTQGRADSLKEALNLFEQEENQNNGNNKHNRGSNVWDVSQKRMNEIFDERFLPNTESEGEFGDVL